MGVKATRSRAAFCAAHRALKMSPFPRCHRPRGRKAVPRAGLIANRAAYLDDTSESKTYSKTTLSSIYTRIREVP